MRNFDNEKFETVIAGLEIARQIAMGEEPVFTHGWSQGNAKRCSFCNDHQAAHLVPLTHGDPKVLQAMKKVAPALGLSGELPPNLNMAYVYAHRPEMA
jgi:hypothetical protein